MKKTILFVIFISFHLSAEFTISIPDSFRIIINNEIIQFNQSWYDSLKSEAKQNIIHYQLAGYHSYNHTAFAKLRIPQTLSFKQVIKQVIFYYGLLDNETEREKIKIRVFSSYSESSKPWYVTYQVMTKKEFDKYIKDFRVQEFKDVAWRANVEADDTYSWEKGYINELHD